MKKGISALITTVILLGATIVLATVLYSWTSDLFKEDKTSSSCKLELEKLCAQSSIGISQVNVNETGALSIFMENTGNYAIKASRVTAYLSNNSIYSTVVNYSQPLPPFYPINFTLNYFILNSQNPPGPIYRSIEISPIINLDFEEENCETLCPYKATRDLS